MTAAELSEYCRKYGLYPEQIEAWKNACLGANAETEEQARHHRKATRTKQKRVRKLESELRSWRITDEWRHDARLKAPVTGV